MEVTRTMKCLNRVIVTLCCALFLLVGCGSGGSAQSEGQTVGLPIAFGLPRVVAVNVSMSRGLVVEAVYQATALSGGASVGRIVNTGTLVLGPAGLQYQPGPTDRLVLKLGTQTHEFVVKDAQGNMSAATSTAWLFSPHRLHYTHRIPGQAEADISLSFDGHRFQAKVKGWSMVSGARYTVDLTASGQSASKRDYHGQDVQTEYNLSGNVQSDGFAVEVDERHSFSMAAATNLRLLQSMRGSASQFNGTLNNVLRVGEDEYKFDSVQIQTDMKDRGGTGSAGVTSATGQVLLNGKPFGRCVLQSGRVFLETEGGQIMLDLPLGKK